MGILGYYVVYNECDVEMLCLMSAFTEAMRRMGGPGW